MHMAHSSESFPGAKESMILRNGRRRGSPSRLTSFILIPISILFVFGCGDDNGSNPDFECEHCEHWTVLTPDHRGSFPDYHPGSLPSERLLAFSSDLGTDNVENIWVQRWVQATDETTLFPITNSERDEFDPAWSPDGNWLAFTRSADERFDIYVINVEDLSNPGDEVRLTSETPIPGDPTELPFRPSGPVWLDEDEILFSNGVDVFAVTLGPDMTPVAIEKVIDDPSDYIFSNVDDFKENQVSAYRDGAGEDHIFFVSDTRVPLGSIFIRAIDVETGENIQAEIFLEGSPTMVETPRVVGGRPAGRTGTRYRVGARVTNQDAENTFCDTLISEEITVFQNDTSVVELEFEEDRGTILLITESNAAKLFYDGNKLSSISADTTVIDCVFPGVDHVVKIESITRFFPGGNKPVVDSACVRLDPEGTAVVRLNATDLDSLGMSDSACVGFTAKPRNRGQNKMSGVQDHLPIMWQYDSENGSYTALVGHGLDETGIDIDATPSFPSVSPDGRYVALILEFSALIVLDLDSGGGWLINLPGEAGINICDREIAYPTWSPDGTRIAVSMSPCVDQPSSDGNSAEFRVWEVNWESARTQ